MSSVEIDRPVNGAADSLRRNDHREMDQVRDLLFGNAQRQVNDRMADLSRSLGDLQAGFEQRLKQIEADMIARDKRMAELHSRQMAELGRALTQLGEKVIALAATSHSGSNGHDRDSR